MSTVFPVTCLVPGPWPDAAMAPTLGHGWSVTWIDNHGQFGRAFTGTGFPASRVGELDGCPGALLVEGAVDTLSDSEPLVTLARALVDERALAVRVEQSRAGWASADWCRLLSTGQLMRALVVLVSGDERITSCGMHLFGLADAEVDDPDDGPRLVDALCTYQLNERPVLLSGHTFRPDENTLRRTLERWPDGSFPQSHPCWNPFGVWRLLARSTRRPTNPLMCLPSLAAQLRAAETRWGRPLERADVEAVRDASGCVVMDPADASQLERSRGYADIDPELAWEQWQILRGTLT